MKKLAKILVFLFIGLLLPAGFISSFDASSVTSFSGMGHSFGTCHSDGSLTFSVFVLSTYVKSQDIKDILVSIATLSATIMNGLVFGFVINDYRQKKK